jgi:hypothetical protein
VPLFGGIAGQFPIVAPRARPPVRVCRVVSGPIWWRRMHWPWRQYLAAVATGIATATPPQLAPPGAAGIYVSDGASLKGCDSPSDFAWRLALSAQDQQDCQLYGCAVIRFSPPQPVALASLPVLPGATPGLTGNGAREWLLAGNLALARSMRVDYVERTPQGARHYRLPL